MVGRTPGSFRPFAYQSNKATNNNPLTTNRMPTPKWWTTLESEYPDLVPYYDAKYAFLTSISPLHGRLFDIWRMADVCVQTALQDRRRYWDSGHEPLYPTEVLRYFGMEADSYELLFAMDAAWGPAVEWIQNAMRSELIPLEAFLSDEQCG